MKSKRLLDKSTAGMRRPLEAHMKKIPEAGAIVYSINGEEAEFIARVGGEYLVRPIYEVDPDECYAEPSGPHYDHPQTWREIFSKPPLQRLHEETQERMLEIGKANTELMELRAQIAAEQADWKSREDTRKQFKQLERLDDFINHRITHIILKRGGSKYSMPTFEIKTYADAMTLTSDYGKKSIRLVSIDGNSDGDLSFSRWGYGDGSGHAEDFKCFTSLEAAQEFVRTELDKEMVIVRRDTEGDRFNSKKDIQSSQRIGPIESNARLIGYMLPEYIELEIARRKRENDEKYLAVLRAEHAKQEAKIAEVEARLSTKTEA
jgi:hypothetical protein